MEIQNQNQSQFVKTIKKYTNKNNEEIVKEYNQKIYNDKYYKNNSSKFKETYLCPNCNKNVSKANKFNHERTKGHILHEKYNIDFKNI